jgi:hypothetical protein
MAEKVVKINKGTVCNVLESENKGNKTRKDCNALIGSVRVEVRGVFFY